MIFDFCMCRENVVCCNQISLYHIYNAPRRGTFACFPFQLQRLSRDWPPVAAGCSGCCYACRWLGYANVIIRPPDIVVGGLMFYHGFFLLFSPPNVRARWTELNQNRPHARKWLRFENVCPKSGVSPPPPNRGPQNHLSQTTSQLNSDFNGLYLRNETRHRLSVKCVDNYKESIHRLNMPWTLVHKRLKTRPAFLPTLHKFCILLHCQASQTEISKQNSTTLCQTADAKSR